MASTTLLRPATISLPSRLPRRGPGRPEVRFAEELFPKVDLLTAAAAWREALWPLRSVAFGVGPLPSSARRRCPPDPTVGPFLLPGLRTAPTRLLLPATSAPVLARRGERPA